MRDALIVVAALLVCAGVAFVYWPFALILGGVILAAFVLLTE